jgi:hypothetical protein
MSADAPRIIPHTKISTLAMNYRTIHRTAPTINESIHGMMLAIAKNPAMESISLPAKALKKP